MTEIDRVHDRVGGFHKDMSKTRRKNNKGRKKEATGEERKDMFLGARHIDSLSNSRPEKLRGGGKRRKREKGRRRTTD